MPVKYNGPCCNCTAAVAEQKLWAAIMAHVCAATQKAKQLNKSEDASSCPLFVYLQCFLKWCTGVGKLMKLFSEFAFALFICMCFLNLQSVELSGPPYIKV